MQPIQWYGACLGGVNFQINNCVYDSIIYNLNLLNWNKTMLGKWKIKHWPPLILFSSLNFGYLLLLFFSEEEFFVIGDDQKLFSLNLILSIYIEGLFLMIARVFYLSEPPLDKPPPTETQSSMRTVAPKAHSSTIQ